MFRHSKGFQSVSKFQELLQIFRKNKLALVLGICFQTLRSRKRGFLHKAGFSLPHRYHFDGRKLRSSESKEPRFRLPKIVANAVIIQTSKWSQMNLATDAGNPGWTCTPPKLVCCEAWCLGSNNTSHLDSQVSFNRVSVMCGPDGGGWWMVDGGWRIEKMRKEKRRWQNADEKLPMTLCWW